MKNWLVLMIFCLGNRECNPVPVENIEPTDYWFAVIDSVEERWDGHYVNGDHWFASYDTEEVFQAINDWDVEFIITTGDNIANPIDEATMRLKLENMLDRMDFYLDAPVYYTAGNHDLNGVPTPWARAVWQEYLPLNHDFWYGGAHFVLLSNGDSQMEKLEVNYPEDLEWYCNTITSGSLSFRHIVKSGYYPDRSLAYYPCEFGVVDTVFFGHYGVNEEFTHEDTKYIQTADAKDGAYRLVHIVDGHVTENIVFNE